MLDNILPPGLITAKLQDALDTEVNDLYFVGHNARAFLYKFPFPEKGYHFVLSYNGAISNRLMLKCEELFPTEFKKDEGDLSSIFIKGDTFDVHIDAIPIDHYLLRSVFAGDGISIHVVSGRLLVIPEYLTVQPNQQIRDENSIGLPESLMLADTKEALDWKLNHRGKLTSFKTQVDEYAKLLRQNEPNQQN